MTLAFGLGTRLRVCMRTRLENGVLRNGQQPDSAVNIQGKVEAYDESTETLNACSVRQPTR